MPVFTRIYTGSGGVPINAKPAILVHNTKMNCVAVPFPSTGFLTKLVVVQTGGTNKAFVVEVLNSKIPYPVGEQPASTSPVDNVSLYRIAPQQAQATPGAALEVINQEQGYPFINVDGTPTNNQRFIYVVIIPTSSVDDTTWDIAATCHDNYGTS